MVVGKEYLRLCEHAGTVPSSFTAGLSPTEFKQFPTQHTKLLLFSKVHDINLPEKLQILVSALTLLQYLSTTQKAQPIEKTDC